ncbi:MAG: sodium:alanine symporter family protein, partial [Planctomycetes bacterium]|nr:sodium:alanine symporter family protein [Planctomycetota bacterium]
MNFFEQISGQIAGWIWNPFLCIFYMVTGCLLLLLTRGIIWKKTPRVFLRIVRSDRSAYTAEFIPHTKAFLSAVAATVGVGNLAGVGTAIHLGGPGALCWMWISALFGMLYRMA